MTETRQTPNKRSFLSISLLSICVAFVWQFEVFLVNGSQCGNVFISIPLVFGGNQISRGQWPFLASLYKVSQTESYHFCGGTVISTKQILTAAHCIQGKSVSKKRSPDDIIVRLGAYNLTAKNERGAVQRRVSEIYVYPEWDIYSDRYDADIAILLLRESVTFSNYIQPVCLPPDDVIIDGATIHNVKGYVVGWGISEKRSHEEIPRHAIVKAINDSFCYRADEGAVSISSERTFCSGEGDGVPNEGDSGGGLFVVRNSAWVQYGIISARRTNGTGHVTLDSFSIYTNVQIFKDWIGETVAFKENRINFNCSYNYTEENEYTCWVDDVNIRGKYVEVASFTGHHQHGRTNDNVEALTFEPGKKFYLPYKIGEFFVNLKRLVINSYLVKYPNCYKDGDSDDYICDDSENDSEDDIYFSYMKHISRSNLKNLENLMSITILKNDIVSLERDCLPQLTSFRIHYNTLKALPEKLFEKNLNLRDVDLSFSELESLPRNLFSNNAKLVTVDLLSNELQMLPTTLFQRNSLLEKISIIQNRIKTIDENIFASNINLKEVHFELNDFEIFPQNLFQRNPLLEEIDLSRNRLNIINENLFASNINLKEVHLEYNKIEILPANLFQSNPLLEKINLSHNSLKIINVSSFASNINLKKVSLENNKLEILPANLFQRNPLLEEIDLSDNPLKIIDTDFSSLRNIKDIYVDDTCISGYYSVEYGTFKSLTELQSAIRANCSSV